MKLLEDLKKDIEERFGIDNLTKKDKSKKYFLARYVYANIINDRFDLKYGKGRNRKKYKGKPLFLKDIIRYTGLTNYTLSHYLHNFDKILLQYPDVVSIYKTLKLKYVDPQGDLDLKLKTIHEEICSIKSSLDLIENFINNIINMKDKNIIYEKDEWDK